MSKALQQAYGLRYFAKKFGLTTVQAVKLMREHGQDRTALNAAGARLQRVNQAKK